MKQKHERVRFVHIGKLIKEDAMSQRLVSLAAAADDVPTLKEVDAMLTELGRLPRDHTNTTLINELLDLREMLAR